MNKSCDNNFKNMGKNAPSSVKVGSFLFRNPRVTMAANVVINPLPYSFLGEIGGTNRFIT
jgi:hypothetical protein